MLLSSSARFNYMLCVVSCLLANISTAAVTESRSYDGSGNNPTFVEWGSTGTSLMRITEPSYPDGMGNELVDWPNARTISNATSGQIGDMPNDRNMSGFVWQWGQFLDHDISLTESHPDNGTAHIMVEPNDMLAPMIPFNRSNYAEGTGTAVGNPRQQINQITSYIDASNIYGSDGARSAMLRSFEDGKLIESNDKLMPMDTNGHFMSGDVRANEQIALVAMHTLFMREHNRIAVSIAANAIDLPVEAAERDEEIYQRARKVVGAEMQAITYNEFLPALLGDRAPDMSTARYDATIDPSIMNGFSTGIYRFGHSMLPSVLHLRDNDGSVTETIPLRDAFFKPSMMSSEPDRMERILKGLAMDAAEEIDTRVVDDVRNFLMLEMMPMGLDLAALNIQRGRDHGLPSYNNMRRAYQLTPAAEFDDVTSDPELQRVLGETYDNIEDFDLFVGTLAEDHLPGSSVGELLSFSMVEQFTRLRDGDRLFYLFDPDIPQLEIESGVDIDSISLGQVIQANTGLSNLQENVFFVPEPSSLGLLFLGTLALLRCRRK